VKRSGVKLSRELAKRATGKTLYILDEPPPGCISTTSSSCCNVLHRLRDEATRSW